MNRCYKAVVNRGCITPRTTNSDFHNKLCEEDNELLTELFLDDSMESKTLTDRQAEELTDVMAVCIDWLINAKRDPVKELEKVCIKNENRED